MDIIAAHQQGLIEQLDAEVAALSGRPHDFAQRAVVLHHLFDHSRGHHQWALVEARENLRIAGRLAKLRRRLDRWGWTVGHRDEARVALDQLALALGDRAQARMTTAYRAYRLSATQALRGEAEAWLGTDHLRVLDLCHTARREGNAAPGEAVAMLARESEREAQTVPATGLETAWMAIGRTGIGRQANRALKETVLERSRRRDELKGWAKVEQMLRSDPMLPAAFRANPAQHFYALQRLLRERRRQQWCELCDLEPDAVALAA